MEKKTQPYVTMSADKIAAIIKRAEEDRERAEKAQRETWSEIQRLERRNPDLYRDLHRAYRPVLAKNKG